ncbi:hypothetical protein HPC49_53780, partial [Pyxidicoccus fallax]
SVGGTAYLVLRTRPLAERLVREANALEQERYPRPSHVTPARPGTFAEHLEPLLGDARQLYDERPRELRVHVARKVPCLMVVTGERPVSELPSACREAVERGWERVSRILAATHAEEGGLPRSVGVMPSRGREAADATRMALLHVVELAGLETRLRLARGSAAEAVDVCLDALALSRDMTLGGGLAWHWYSALSHEVLYRACADALDAAPLARKRSAVTQLSRLAEGLASLSRTLREHSVQTQAELFGVAVSGETRDALTPRVRAFLDAHQIPDLKGSLFSLTPLEWRKTVKVFDAMVAVADLPPAARQQAFAAIEEEHTDRFISIFGPQVMSLDGMAQDIERLRLQHDALLLLAEVDLHRAETGRWPQPLPYPAVYTFVLESSDPGEARLAPCSPALKAQALRVTADGPAGTWVRQEP